MKLVVPPRGARNRLLASLSAREEERLAPFLVPVELPLRTSLATSGEPLDAVYFPHDALASIIVAMPEGDQVEVGLVGSDGATPLGPLLGVTTAATTAMIQVEGHAARISVADFRTHVVEHGGELHRLLLRYVDVFLMQVAQTASCNASHSLSERLSRWLLMVQDRVERPAFPMTHEFLAVMLAVRRASITEAAQQLRREGAIAYEQGTMRIRSREALESSACGCNAAQVAFADAVLGSPATRRAG